MGYFAMAYFVCGDMQCCVLVLGESGGQTNSVSVCVCVCVFSISFSAIAEIDLCALSLLFKKAEKGKAE